MEGTFHVSIEKLSEFVMASDLIPGMDEEEWKGFLEDVKENGIRETIHINQDYKVIDGRHRLKAAKILDIEEIEVRQHDFSESEAVDFAYKTAVNRRHLTQAQRIHLALEREDLMQEIENKAKENLIKGREKGGENRHKVALASMEARAETTKSWASEEVGVLSGASRATVNRAKKIKKEAPEEYEKVVKGETSFRKAYSELPSIKEKAKNSTQTDEVPQPGPKRKPRELNQQPPEMTPEEAKSSMIQANASTLHMHLEQLNSFFDRYDDDMDEIIKQAHIRYGDDIAEKINTASQLLEKINHTEVL